MKECLEQFLNEEVRNIESGISEQNLCGRLMLIMHSHLSSYNLSNYYVDNEYNRQQGGEIKTIINNIFEVVNVKCDIILHSRGECILNDNLVAIEMKKSSRPEKEKNKDRVRLIALTKDSYNDIWSNDGTTHPEHVCGYKLGVYLEINLEQRTFLVETYSSGKRDLVKTIKF